MIMNFLSVAVGGALGAMVRYAISVAVTGAGASHAYLATLGVNIVGCALMGVMAASVMLYPGLSSSVRPLLMIGFLGALTTFSSFALDSFVLLEKQHYGMLAAYLASSFILSLTAFFVCFHLTKWGLS